MMISKISKKNGRGIMFSHKTPRIEQLNACSLKVLDIARDNGEAMLYRGSSNHAVIG